MGVVVVAVVGVIVVVVPGAGPDQLCARPEATIAARPLKRTVTV